MFLIGCGYIVSLLESLDVASWKETLTCDKNSRRPYNYHLSFTQIFMHVSCLYLWNHSWLGLRAKVQRTYSLILVANPYGKTSWHWMRDGGPITQMWSQDPPNFLFACFWYLHDELIILQFKSLYFLKCYFLHNYYLKIVAKRFTHVIDSFLLMNNQFTFSVSIQWCCNWKLSGFMWRTKVAEESLPIYGWNQNRRQAG